MDASVSPILVRVSLIGRTSQRELVEPERVSLIQRLRGRKEKRDLSYL
jgi:hypothetical protein